MGVCNMNFKYILFIVATVSIVSCASRSKESVPEVAPSASPVAAPAAPSAAAVVAALSPAPAPPNGHGHDHGAEEGVSAEKAIGWLKNGNKRFLKGHLRRDGQSRKDIARLSKGQKPHTIVLSCSDSRVPPELLFDQKLGEIFVVRTAGESLDDNAIGSIEYAVEHLGARAILVMGHTSCGAVKAALSTLSGGDAGSPALNHLVGDMHPRLRQFSQAPPSENVAKESSANAKGVAEDLLQRSNILKSAVQSGKIRIATALYHVESGRVEFE